MPLTHDEAASALRDIEQTRRKSGEAFGYRIAGPHMILWGVVWAFGYTGSDLYPERAGVIWLAAIAFAAVAAAFIGRAGRLKDGNTTRGWQIIGLVAIVALFIYATYTIMWPVSGKQQAAFVPLLAGAAYASFGLFAGVRWIVAGLSVVALTLLGYFFLTSHFGLWMAFVGGGSLILAGLWMRSA